jgi:uncharacterized membrane protein (UPF0127 family)
MVADNDSLRRTGLLNVNGLDQNQGMLFVYDTSSMRWFTMVNMRFDLDIIYIDEKLEVVHVVEAFIGDDHISSMSPAQYVVEINNGLADQYNIVDGTCVQITYQ